MTEGGSLRWESASRSEAGNVRDLNEDSCLDLPARGLWVVADGMGGHQAGEVASQMVVHSLQDIGTHKRFSEFVNDVEDRVLDTNRRLYSMSTLGEEQQIIGCTLAAMLVHGGYCLNVWAGDSRVYRYRDSTLEQITRDHSEVEDLVDRGEVSAEDAETHELGNVITRAVGGENNLFLDYSLGDVLIEDRYLLCSDGLYKELSIQEMEVLLSGGSCIEACNDLFDAALAKTCSDNVTVIIVDFTEAPD